MGILHQLPDCNPEPGKSASSTRQCERHSDYGLKYHPRHVLAPVSDLTLTLPSFNEMGAHRCCEQESRTTGYDARRSLNNRQMR